MPEDDKTKATPADTKSQSTSSPLIFISHDTRDADLAEAFSTLLRNVSSGMLKSFRSSDKKGNDGIEFGDEWYKRLMERLNSASDVVCLFTERSVERPWILYEAGVAKGKLNKPVLGVALGVPLRSVSTGPFYQFQNCDDSPESLSKLLRQLANRISTLELIDDVVNAQVVAFKERCDQILSSLDETPEDEAVLPSDAAAAKLFEEMKVMIRDLPSRLDDRLSEGIDPRKRRRMRNFHPTMFEEMLHKPGGSRNPVGLMLFAGFIRDDMPWLYELTMESYRAITKGTQRDVSCLIEALEHVQMFTEHGLFMEELVDSQEMHMMIHEFPRMLRRVLQRSLDMKKESS